MQQLKFLLSKWGIHCFLLPVFFVLHSYIQYSGLVSVAATLKVLALIEFAFIVFFLACSIFTKNFNKSAQITTLLGFIYLFYGGFKDFFNDTLRVHFMARYSVLLPILILISILAIIKIIRKKDFSRWNLFQNTLLLLFLLTDEAMFVWSGSTVYRQRNQLVKNNILNPDTLPVSTERPDVYFLVFDSYPGSDFLRDYLQYKNPLDSALRRRGFYVATHSKSNYNQTVFSIAATLNLEYLQNMPDQTIPEPHHFNQGTFSVQHALVPAVFAHKGYQIYNLSFFNLENHPSVAKDNFLTLPENKMLLYNTFPERFRQDILWHFHLLQYGSLDVTERQIKEYQDQFNGENNVKRGSFNDKIIDSLFKIPLLDTARPKFIYAHLYLPHPPFFYDKDGHPLKLDFITVSQSIKQKKPFLSYLEYTNKVILKITDSLLNNPGRQPVIVVQSDHGYRDFDRDFAGPAEYFKNYSSFYFPDKNYSMLYDSISNINTFQVIFDKYFRANIPLQKDISVKVFY